MNSFLLRKVPFLLVLAFTAFAAAQDSQPAWTADEKPIADRLHNIRSVPDDARVQYTRDLALNIRKLPAGENKLRLAFGLANRATEGDFGHDTLQEVTTTLADALREHPVPWAKDEKTKTDVPAGPYVELATLVRYERMQAESDNPQFAAAMAKLEADDRKRQDANFALKDLNGKQWSLKDLRGKVVLLNFWATWCPPCRKEMPDLEKLYERFEPKGFVVLAISDEEENKVKPFTRERNVSFPVLLDPGRKVNDLFVVEGIPKSFVYNREGQLVSQSIDMRTQKQFLEMLGKAGLE